MTWVLPPSINSLFSGSIKGYIQPYYTYYPTVTEGGGNTQLKAYTLNPQAHINLPLLWVL